MSHDDASDGLQPKESVRCHFQQQPPVLEPIDVCSSVGTFLVPDKHFDDFQIELRGPKQQIKIAKGIEITKIGTIGRDSLIRPCGIRLSSHTTCL